MLGEPPSSVGYGLASHSVARVKIFGAHHPVGAKIWSSEKVDFVDIIALLNLRN